MQEDNGMRKVKIVCLVLIGGLLLAGCASKLGYPAKTVGIPTPVTLFAQVSEKGTLTNTMNWAARDIWSALYQKKFEEVLSKVALDKLQRRLNVTFARDAAKSKDLFNISSSEMLDARVPYAKAKSDPPEYSGFDFSQYRYTIPTQYVLALSIDEWGLIAAQNNKDNGPYISLTIQLIDKETNNSLWRYNYLFLQQVDKDANELTTAPHLEDIYDRLIPRSVDAFFMWLGY
jgi:hypothetical protein